MPRDSTLYTIADAARQLALSRQRVHQLVRLLGITPVSVLGRLALTPAQIATLRGRVPGRPGRKPARDLTGQPIPRCACGRAVYAEARCYECYQSPGKPAALRGRTKGTPGRKPGWTSTPKI